MASVRGSAYEESSHIVRLLTLRAWKSAAGSPFAPSGNLARVHLYALRKLSLLARGHGVALIRNPIAPASYLPPNPYARIVTTLKSRGSDQRGGNASEDMPAPMCNDLPWEDLWSKKPVEDGAGGTVQFKPRRAIHLWLGQAERNANNRPSEAR